MSKLLSFLFLIVYPITSKEGPKCLWSPWACWSVLTPRRPETQFTRFREPQFKWNTPSLLHVCIHGKQRHEGSRKNVKFGGYWTWVWVPGPPEYFPWGEDWENTCESHFQGHMVSVCVCVLSRLGVSRHASGPHLRFWCNRTRVESEDLPS